jgi:uncharacterized protein (DUF433 family)
LVATVKVLCSVREVTLRNYAALTDPDIDAALAYAAELTREGTVDLPLEIEA